MQPTLCVISFVFIETICRIYLLKKNTERNRNMNPCKLTRKITAHPKCNETSYVKLSFSLRKILLAGTLRKNLTSTIKPFLLKGLNNNQSKLPGGGGIFSILPWSSFPYKNIESPSCPKSLPFFPVSASSSSSSSSSCNASRLSRRCWKNWGMLVRAPYKRRQTCFYESTRTAFIHACTHIVTKPSIFTKIEIMNGRIHNCKELEMMQAGKGHMNQIRIMDSQNHHDPYVST